MKKTWLLGVSFICIVLGLSLLGYTYQKHMQRLQAQTTYSKMASNQVANRYSETIQSPKEIIMPEKATTKNTFEVKSIAPYHLENMLQNEDYIGWLRIDQTKLDYPVVRGDDNTFYLNRDFQLKSSELGSIFIDYRNLGNLRDAHTIIYGHYVKNGAMFGSLEGYLEEDYWKNHPVVIWDTPFGEKKYEVFSVQIVSARDYQLPLETDQAYIRSLADASLLPSLSLEVIDKYPIEDEFVVRRILTLATCTYSIEDGRLLIHAIELP